MTADPDGPADGSDGRTLPGRRWRRHLLAGAALLAFAWIVAALVLLVSGLRAADQGRAELRSVAGSLDLSEVLDGEDDVLGSASEDFDRADDLLGSPVLTPLRWTPIAGRQIRSASQLASTSARLLGDGRDTLEEIRTVADGGTGTAEDRLRLVETTGVAVDRLLVSIRGADLGGDEALIAPLREARADAAEQLADVERLLADLRQIVGAVEETLRGPSSYLVVAANNAEMRVGSGMFLSMGTISFEDGAFEVGEFTPAVDLQLDDPVPLDDEIDALWGWADPGREWRNLGFTPRFPVNAATATAMWERSGREPVDGVLLVDVLGLQHLLRATGPVETEAGTLGADDIVPFLLREQYVGVDSGDANAARREQLSAVAGDIVARIGDGDVEPADLYGALRDAQRGRHLLLWSADGEHQAAWAAASIEGDLDDRSLLLGLANAGGTKTDPFVQLTTTAESHADGDEVDVTLSVVIDNDTPDGLPAYMLGPEQTEDYDGVLVAYLPSDADDVEVDGGTLIASGPDGPSDALGVAVDVPQGEETVVRIRFRLSAARADDVRLEGSARIPASGWIVDATEMSDSRAQSVSFAP